MVVKKVFVTGGTGFIGTRFIQKCIMEWDINITALVRNYSRLSRLARFEKGAIQYEYGSINNLDSIDSIKSCDCVVHFAFDSTSLKNNLVGINNIIEKCKLYNKRLIHISTISVYEPLLANKINEKITNIPPKSNSYAYSKYLIEKEVWEKIEKNNLDAIIIQPTIVYGPFGASWTDRIINQLDSGTVILPDEGRGICNPVYIDDLCDGILLSCKVDRPQNRKFLISGPDHVEWREFYGEFSKIVGKNSLKYKPRIEIQSNKNNPFKFFKIAISNPLMFVSWEPMKSILKSLQYKIPSSVKLWIKEIYLSYKKLVPNPVFLPDKNLLDLFISKSIVEIDLAKNDLGYDPRIHFNKGMDTIKEYIDWAYPTINGGDE